LKKLFVQYIFIFFTVLAFFISADIFAQNNEEIHEEDYPVTLTNDFTEADSIISNDTESELIPVKPVVKTNLDIKRYYFLDDENQTNVITVTNVVMEKPIPEWKLPVTNIFEISNIIVSNDITNYQISTNTNVVLYIREAFPSLIDIRPIESADDLRERIASILFPMAEIGIEKKDMPRWQRRVFMRKTLLLPDSELAPFNQDIFNRMLLRRKFRRLEFTPEEQKHLHIGFEQWDTKVIIQGRINLRMGYGWTTKDENFPHTVPGITSGFNIDQKMQVNVTGKFGERVSVSINQDSQSPDNFYEIAYKALDTDMGILKELKAGNISLNIPQSSHFVRYSGTSEESYGLKAVFEKNNFNLQTILNLTTSKKGYKKFSGSSRLETRNLMDVSYIKRQYFILPDKNIDNGSIEILQHTAETNLADRRIDNLYFRRLIEGENYYINYSSGEVNLKSALPRGTYLAVRYTVAGGNFTKEYPDFVGYDNQSGEEFLYLWKADKNMSPYVHYGYYNLGYRDFDPTRGFTLEVVQTADRSKLADFQFTPADYEINPITGILKFKNTTPFPDTEGRIYSYASDPVAANSEHTMLITLYNQVKTYRLDFGIIPDTERVLVNGRELAKHEYTIIYALGELIFNNPALINENDTIEIYYEYKPFFVGTQKFGVASRFDWRPSNIINLGSTLVYNISQRAPGGAPRIGSTPPALFMGDIDGTLNITRMLGISEDYQLTVQGEFALSVLDVNSAGYAVIDDFEGAGETFALSGNEARWILAAPSTNIQEINYTNRGHLLYRDYREYKLDGSFSMLNYDAELPSDKILDYSFKPGPYLTLGGHLDASEYPQVSQTSLVFDFDFDKGDWVGSAISIAGPGGQNFSEYNQIVIWAKLQDDENRNGKFSESGNLEVELYLVAGQLNEDSDGDGILDAEIDRAQPGYEFNNYTNHNIVETYVGRGRRGGGDGYIQTEDLNRNGVLDTDENTLVFPSSQGYTDIENVVLTQDGWQKITINIRSLTPQQVAILERVSAVGLFIKQRNGTRGRVLLDNIEFRTIRWRDKKIDGYKTSQSELISGEALSVHTHPIYSANRFYILNSGNTDADERAEVFESLHGPRTVSEANQLNETTLAIHYQLTNIPYNPDVIPPIGGKSATLIRNNPYPFDITRYRNLSFYIFVPSKDELGNPIKRDDDTFDNENFVFILGNSDKSYYKWTVPLNQVKLDDWNKIEIALQQGLVLSLNEKELSAPHSIGVPNLKDINYIELGAEVVSDIQAINRGTIWVNQMYVSLDDAVIGTAYFINPKLEIKNPIWTINNFEIFGPLTLNTRFENKGYNFVATEGESAGNSDYNFSINLNSRIFRYLNYIISFNRLLQGTSTNEIETPEYLQWNNQSERFNFTLNFNAQKPFVPRISHTFTDRFENHNTRNLVNHTNYDYILNIANSQYISTVSFNLDQNIPVSQNFIITPSFKISESFYLNDKSNYTNEEGEIYITNSSVYGMRNLKKDMGGGIGFNFWRNKLNIGANYDKSHEMFDKIMDYTGFRNEIEDLRSITLAERFGQRIESMSKGFYFEDEIFEKAQNETISASINANRPVKYFSLIVRDSFGIRREGFAYTADGNLSSRTEGYNLRNYWELTFFPHFWNINKVLDKINFKINREANLSYNSIQTNIEPEEAVILGQIYYMQPLHYNAFFMGGAARTNALELVAEFSDGIYNSRTSLIDRFNMEITLPSAKGFWASLLPRVYNFSTTLNTSRNLNSFSQTTENNFNFILPIKLSELDWSKLRSTNRIQVGDINSRFSFQNTQNFNDRKILNTFIWELNHRTHLSQTLNFQLAYNFKLTDEFYIAEREDFEARYGLVSPPPRLSPLSRYDHSMSLTANWIIKDLKDLHIWKIRINLRGSQLENRNVLRFTRFTIDYDGALFTRYNHKLFEIYFEHSTQYRFSEIITGRLIAKTVVDQYAEISPLGLNDVNITIFDPGFGFEISLDMQINI
jgi:hypothetical protein